MKTREHEKGYRADTLGVQMNRPYLLNLECRNRDDKPRASCHAFASSYFRGYVCFFFVFLLLLSGCSHSAPNIYARKDRNQIPINKVAVFPFHNNTRAAEASEIVTGAFMAGLVKMGRFEVEFPGNIKSFLVSERIIVRSGVDLHTIKLMGKRLGVDAVVIGEVEEYIGARKPKENVIPVVSISTRIVDARTGKVLWMAQHRRTGDDYIKVLDFGKVRSAGALTRKVVGEMIETMPKY